MILRELVTRLGFELDDKNLKRFEQSIDVAKSKLASLGKDLNDAKLAVSALVATATGLTILSVSVAKSAAETDKLSDKLGITTDDLQSLELVAQNAGLEVNELSKSFSSFNRQLGTVDTTSKVVSDELNRLNISTIDNNGNLKSSFTLYGEVARKISAIRDPIKQAAISQKLLGTSNKEVIKLFNTTNESFQKQRDEILKLGYVIDSKGIQSSKNFIKSWNNLKIIIDGVKKELSVKFMPIFSRTIDMFKTWYIANREIISQNITGFINVLSSAFNFLFKVINIVISPINYVVNLLGGLENAARVLSITLTLSMIPRLYAAASAVKALTFALLSNPVTWVTSAIIALSGAIALIIDDLIAWKNGNNSLIASLLKDWFGFEKTFDEIIDNVVDYFKTSFESLSKWFTSLFDGILETINTVKEFIGSGVDAVKEKTIFRNVISKEEKKLNIIQDGTKVNTINDDIANADLERKQTILRKIELIDESNLIDDETISNKLQPLINPSSSFNGVSPINNSSTANKVNQYITENVTVNVPVGTTAEQSRIIADQVTNVFQEQFNYNILRGLDSLSNR